MQNQVITFGCRLNAYESSMVKQNMDAAGLAGAILFNTCAVTSEAERQARQAIRKARRENPTARIIVTGCSAQINQNDYQAMPEVDLVLGNNEKMQLESFRQALDSFGDSGHSNTLQAKATAIVSDIMSVRETASHLVSGFEDKARAFVQVQNGCDHRCTFCIIPYGRGNSRSTPLGGIVEQVRILTDAGYREVVLTGVDISDYGKDLPGHPSLGNMVRRLLRMVPDLPRLRISSIDAVEVDDDFYNVLATEERLMPHLHLSLQAGDDMVLKRMKRRHLRHDILNFCAKVRNLRPDVVFGADIIAGFPTETEEMFQNTLNLVCEAGLTYLHVFPYSERPGTPAARMPQVEKSVRKERAARLRTAGEGALQQFLESRIGKVENVLIEKSNMGRTQHYAEVRLPQGGAPGAVIKARITNAHNNFLEGLSV